MRSDFSSAACWSLMVLGGALSACGGSNEPAAVSRLDAQVPGYQDAAYLGPELADTAVDAGLGAAELDASLVPPADAGPDTADAHSGANDAAIVTVVCATQDPVVCPTPPTRYADVQPIIAQRCQICHSPLWTGPWPLDEYEHVVEWQDTIRSAMLDCSMPLPDAGLPSMPVEERQTILSFIRCGLQN